MAQPIRNKTQLLELNLFDYEKDFIQMNNFDVFYFRNGINIADRKHIDNDFQIYFIIGLTSLYLEHIEKQWREFGLPKLCSYSLGR